MKWIVYTSLLYADRSSLSLARHADTEQLLKESGIHTILRNGWYTENYTGSIDGALQAGAFIAVPEREDLFGPEGRLCREPPWYCRKKGTGKGIRAGGDVVHAERAGRSIQQTGKEIPYNNLPEGEYAKVLASAGVPEFAHAIAQWDAELRTTTV